jgi:uncharacterized protein YxeA
MKKTLIGIVALIALAVGGMVVYFNYFDDVAGDLAEIAKEENYQSWYPVTIQGERDNAPREYNLGRFYYVVTNSCDKIKIEREENDSVKAMLNPKCLNERTELTFQDPLDFNAAVHLKLNATKDSMLGTFIYPPNDANPTEQKVKIAFAKP